MKKLILSLAIALSSLAAQSQIQHGGTPLTWTVGDAPANIAKHVTAPIDLELAQAQDLVTDQYKETMYRFGIEQAVDLDFFETATKSVVEGQEVFRLRIKSPNAVTINFLIDDFYMPANAQLYVYSPVSKELKGAFTAENNRENRIFPVGLIGGEELVIEYIGAQGDAALHISEITHGYRPILGYLATNKGPFGSSEACNINVSCPEGDDWDEQIRSVGIIVQGGGVCSGSLINNSQEDETPLFLTANHCIGFPAAWVYYFNHEASSCAGTLAPTNQSVAGGSLLASDSGSDFALIELNSNVPESYNPCFAGFNATDVANVTSAIGIHHPSGDIKKLSIENGNPFKQTINFNGDPNTDVWVVNDWELGVTEPGSSGSPLYNQNGRIIGVLSGGAAACDGDTNNGLYDLYGRLGVAWDDGATASTRLMDHLDPDGSGVLIRDVYCPYDPASSVSDFSASNSFFSLYPNPNSGQLNVQLKEEVGNYELYILNTMGQVVFNQTAQSGLSNILDISLLPSGNYVLQIIGEDASSSQSFSKQ